MDSEDVARFCDLDKLDVVTPERHDFRMSVDRDHVDFYVRNAYEDFSADLICHLCRDGGLFIDIGAHYGYYSLLAASTHKNMKVMAFEPLPENFEILKHNVRLNSIHNILTYNMAVSDNSGEMDFNVTDCSSRGGFHDHVLSKTVKSIKVQTVALDDFLGQVPTVPTVIKVDTEGHEMSVLAGMRSTLIGNTDVVLLVEFSPLMLERAGYRPEHFFRELEQLGFEMYLVDDERGETFRLDGRRFGYWKSYFGEGNYLKDYFNVLCMKTARSLSVCFFNPPSQPGEAESSFLDLAKRLVANDAVLCSVVLPDDGSLRTGLQEAGVSTMILDYDRWCNPTMRSDETMEDLYSTSLVVVFDQLEKLQKVNPDVVFSSPLAGPCGAVAATILGKPHVWLADGLGDSDLEEAWGPRFRDTLEFVRDSSNIILVYDTTNDSFLADTAQEKTVTITKHADPPSNAAHPNGLSYPLGISSGQGLADILRNQKNAVNAAAIARPQFLARFMLGALFTLQRKSEAAGQKIEVQISEFTAALQARDAQISEFTAALQARDAQMVALEAVIQQVNRSLSTQLLTRYRRVADKVLPLGTLRRRLYDLPLRGLRVILNEGWRAFWCKARARMAPHKTRLPAKPKQ